MNNKIEARPFEEYKEMIKSMSKEEMIKGLYDLSKSCIEKDNEIEKLRKITKQDECDYYVEGLEGLVKEQNREIERLNNIINELEKWCLSWKENDKYCYLASNDKDKCRYDIWEEVLDKLQELKGDSSNE